MTPDDDIPEITPAMWARAAPRAAWEQARALVKAWVVEDGSNFIVLEERIAVALAEARATYHDAAFEKNTEDAALAREALAELVAVVPLLIGHLRKLETPGWVNFADMPGHVERAERALKRARTVLGEETP